MSSPRSSEEIIGMTADHGRQIQGPEEYWSHLEQLRFHERYRNALVDIGMPLENATDHAYMVRTYIERIAGGLRDANYLIRQLAGELNAAQQETRGWPQQAGARFRV